MTILLFAALVLYLVFLIVAGIRRARRLGGLEDFFLASRGLSWRLMGLSLGAAWFGASSILVTSGEAFQTGSSALWIVGVPSVAAIPLLLALAFAEPIHALPFLSLPDLVETRYGRTVRHMSAFLVVWYMVLLAASQMVAAGLFLKAFLGTSYLLSLFAAVAVVSLYATAGGLLSVARADRFQFFLLAAGIMGLFLSLRLRTSFHDVAAAAAAAGTEGFFDPFRNFGRNGLMAVSFTLAWTVSPIAWQRMRSVRTVSDARRGLFLSAALLSVLFAAITASGMMLRPVFGASPDLQDPLSRYISGGSGPWLGALLFVSVMAAIVSTMDAAVNTGALHVTRDVLQQIFPRFVEKRAVSAGRMATVLVGGAAFIAAAGFQDILKTIGLASQIMAQGLFVPGMAMLFLKKKIPEAGFLSLLLGGGFSILAFLSDAGLSPLRLPAWPFSLPYGLVLGAAGFAAGLGFNVLRTQRRPSL